MSDLLEVEVEEGEPLEVVTVTCSYSRCDYTYDGAPGESDLDVFDNSDLVSSEDGFLCPSHYFECGECDERFSIDDATNALSEQGYDRTVCEWCYRQNYHYCESCDQSVHDSHECESYDDENVEGIHDYSYKPEPVFSPEPPSFKVTAKFNNARYTNEMFNAIGDDGRKIDRKTLAYLGIELETESTDDLYELVNFLGNESHNENAYYLKHDGSLDRGVEIVSHPRTLDSWKEYSSEFGQILSDAGRMGARCWNKNTCGLHGHISRIAFDGESHVARFATLFTRSPRDSKEYAQRESSYARFEGMARISNVIAKTKGNYSDHFDAINLEHSNTIEVRIFRPSLRIGRVLAALEIVSAACEYSRITPATKMTRNPWVGFGS